MHAAIVNLVQQLKTGTQNQDEFLLSAFEDLLPPETIAELDRREREAGRPVEPVLLFADRSTAEPRGSALGSNDEGARPESTGNRNRRSLPESEGAPEVGRLAPRAFGPARAILTTSSAFREWPSRTTTLSSTIHHYGGAVCPSECP